MKIVCLLISLFLYIFVFSQNNSGKLIILHSNDLHSNLTGFSPESEYTPCTVGDDDTRAGFARIAAMIDAEKKKNPDKVLVLDAGDYLMGTFFHVFEINDGFQLNLMKKMGYDIVSVGNHEFDFGPNTIAKIINKNLEKGEIPQIVFANVEFSKKSDLDDEFEKLFDKEIIKTYTIIEKENLKIGVFGILGDDATEVAPNSKPLKITNRIKTSKKIVKILREKEKVDIVICLSHSGVTKDKNGNWAGEDIELAKKVKGIDLIISGHTHTEIFDPIIVNNTPIVQTGAQGKNLGRYEMNIENGKIKSAKYQLMPVDDNIYGDCKIHQEISNRIRLIDDSILRPLNLGYFRPLAETDYNLECNEQGDLSSSNLGPLVADAIYYYVNNFSNSKTDIALVAAGVIRDKIRVGKEGVQTAVDIFRVMSLGEGEDGMPGYPLAQVYLTAKEIKNLFEILLVAPKMHPAYHCYFSGVKITYDKEKGMLRKIEKIEIDNKEIDFSKKNKTLYSLSANSYMLEFVGKVRGMTMGLVKISPKNEKGEKIKNNKETWIDFDENKPGVQEGKEWIALVKFLQSFPDTDGNKLPNFPEKYNYNLK
ncbi:bifunctional metallophosphatase/5'-nucleotidase [Aliarcobacter skirrowii]|jgi:5'-nucleotidase|uniref:bifunctional metallophosphatase/5'-nucleotidase n=1 Tax=Aliarcobacter skirrowii TaxID=28200 RepID=UPI002A369A85|nr:bifunctional metallophosphatase/5'-nucleotidase [Aliarcobacter skirrowii]MCK9255741.1 5'-nucleotidase C-terminal domain-containing protein [Bacteroidales bacterium]MCK9498395.1 5'-nucleotidase C-terminal domain-containing protein [Bacteroidales bacterium]MDY0181662.1 bifunctional metallophosphatase/5'-nucleotidase [Aliarcobacter skirrowii]